MITYTREELINIGDTVDPSSLSSFSCSSSHPSPYRRRRRRGKKGGARVRARSRGFKVPLPSLIIENCQSLNNKKDELSARTEFLSEYRNACAICYIETWLKPITPDINIEPDNFKVFRADRTIDSNKADGYGGLCIFINKSWSKNSTIKLRECSRHLEVLVLSTRPFYLPREITCVIFIFVYLPHSYHKDKIRFFCLTSYLVS